jgi:hypothetical protein
MNAGAEPQPYTSAASITCHMSLLYLSTVLHLTLTLHDSFMEILVV